MRNGYKKTIWKMTKLPLILLALLAFCFNVQAQIPPQAGNISGSGIVGTTLEGVNGTLGDPFGEINELNSYAQRFCNTATNPATLIPNIPGLSEIKNVVNSYNELQNLTTSMTNYPLQSAINLANGITQYSPTVLLSKVRNVINSTPLGNISLSSITGNVLSGLLNAVTTPQNQQKLTELYNVLMAQYTRLQQEATNSARTAAERQEAYQKAQEVYASMGRLHELMAANQSEIINELRAAQNQLNQTLQQTELGEVIDTLKEVVKSHKDGTIFEKAKAIVQKVKKIAKVVNFVRDKLKEICGHLPNGPVKDELLALLPDVMNGKVETILNNLLRKMEETLMKKSAKLVDRVLGPLANLGEGVLNTLITSLSNVLRTGIMNTLREGFNALINRAHMGAVLGRNGCRVGQQAFAAAAQVGRRTIQEEIAKRTNKVQGFWNTPNVVKCR